MPAAGTPMYLLSSTPSRYSPPTGYCGVQQAAVMPSTLPQPWALTPLCCQRRGYWPGLSWGGRRSSWDAWSRCGGGCVGRGSAVTATRTTGRYCRKNVFLFLTPRLTLHVCPGGGGACISGEGGSDVALGLGLLCCKWQGLARAELRRQEEQQGRMEQMRLRIDYY
jgi:hypothetical protein